MYSQYLRNTENYEILIRNLVERLEIMSSYFFYSERMYVRLMNFC